MSEYTNTIPIENVVNAMLEAYQPLVDVFGDDMEPDRITRQSAKRYLVYHIIHEDPVQLKQRAAVTVTVRVQIDTYASTRATASADGLLCRAAFDNKTGMYGGLEVSRAWWESYNGTFDQGNERYKAVNDFMLRVNLN